MVGLTWSAGEPAGGLVEPGEAEAGAETAATALAPGPPTRPPPPSPSPSTTALFLPLGGLAAEPLPPPAPPRPPGRWGCFPRFPISRMLWASRALSRAASALVVRTRSSLSVVDSEAFRVALGVGVREGRRLRRPATVTSGSSCSGW